ncbi:MAG: hypothetical protein P1S46_12325, partial [bacterium]|nr:hypothetical protein [bacterium]
YPNSGIAFHDPARKSGALYQYLKACADQTDDCLDESQVEVVSWDMEKDRLQENRELVVHGEKHWGSDPKQLAKYALLRYFPFLLN